MKRLAMVLVTAFNGALFNGALFIVALGCVALGCGGGQAAQETTPEHSSGTASETQVTVEAPSTSSTWAEMNHEQRAQFMQERVVPEMTPLFQAFDGEEFAEFGCATCHGDNAKEVEFHMPNGLAPLDPAQIPAMFESQQPMALFMTQKVWPKMTELLGEPPYNPETHEGFGCLNCHATKQAESAALLLP